MAARWNGTPWRFQSLSELINPTKQVFTRERRNMMAYRAMGPDRFMSTVLHQDRLLGLQSDFDVVGGVGAILDYPREEATADTRLHIEFNDVGGRIIIASGWPLGNHTKQITNRIVQLPGDGRFCPCAPFSAGAPMLHWCFPIKIGFWISKTVRLFTYLGDHIESLSDGLRGEDEARANYYLALAIRFRRVASTHWTSEVLKDAVKAHCDPVGRRDIDQSERLEESGFVMKLNYFEFLVSESNDINLDCVGRELESGQQMPIICLKYHTSHDSQWFQACWMKLSRHEVFSRPRSFFMNVQSWNVTSVPC